MVIKQLTVKLESVIEVIIEEIVFYITEELFSTNESSLHDGGGREQGARSKLAPRVGR